MSFSPSEIAFPSKPNGPNVAFEIVALMCATSGKAVKSILSQEELERKSFTVFINQIQSMNQLINEE